MIAPPPLQALISAVEQATSAPGLLQATRALADRLAEARHNSTARWDDPTDPAAVEPAQSEAIGCLVEVLGFNNPGAAVAAVDGLIALGPAAVEPLLQRLDPRNYGARAWAVRALAGIGDVRGLALLEEALASDVGPSVRRAAACGLGSLQLQRLNGPERPPLRSRALEALLAGGSDGEWVVRYAVAVGLEGLVLRMQPTEQETGRALEALAQLSAPEREEAPVVRLRAGLARQRLLAVPSDL